MGDLAGDLPVSRPAVSQHLAVLRTAGLVTERRDGTRRLYRGDPTGLAAAAGGRVKSSGPTCWARKHGGGQGFWSHCRPTDSTHPRTHHHPARRYPMSLPPVVVDVEVALPPASAFDLFVDGFGGWWPLATYSCFEGDAADVRFPRKVGAAITEVSTTGDEAPWGTVLTFEPGDAPSPSPGTQEVTPTGRPRSRCGSRRTPQGPVPPSSWSTRAGSGSATAPTRPGRRTPPVGLVSSRATQPAPCPPPRADPLAR